MACTSTQWAQLVAQHPCCTLLKKVTHSSHSSRFLHFTALQRGLCDRKAVRLSVCLSVTRVCDKTNESSADNIIPYESSIHLVFRHEEWLIGDVPYYEILGKTDPAASKTAISNLYSLVAPQPLHLAKKVQLWFPMSLR